MVAARTARNRPGILALVEADGVLDPIEELLDGLGSAFDLFHGGGSGGECSILPELAAEFARFVCETKAPWPSIRLADAALKR